MQGLPNVYKNLSDLSLFKDIGGDLKTLVPVNVSYFSSFMNSKEGRKNMTMNIERISRIFEITVL